jgi:glycosyltransferase involved in cell wall biosynthesis
MSYSCGVVRVILTCNYSPWSSYSGGGQRSTHNLASALAALGHDVTVVFTRAPWERVEVPGDLPYRLRWAALTNVRGKSPGLLRLSSCLPVAAAVAELLREGAPAVVHSQGEEGAALPMLRRLTKLRFAFVVTPRHGKFPAAVLAGRAASRWTRLRTAIRDSKYPALGVAVRGADYCCPPSHHGKRLVQSTFGLEDARVKPVHNGVPAEFLDYRWAPVEARRPLLFFGRFDHNKGIDTLLDALERLGEAAPDALLVGRGPVQPEIERRLAANPLRVRLHGWADHHQLGRLLEQASMVALPSREENLSLSMLATMAVGTPLIMARVGGTSEVIGDGEHGLLVEPDDAAGLAERIDRLSRDPVLAARLGLAGRKRVRSGFTWDVTARTFEALYADALARV